MNVLECGKECDGLWQCFLNYLFFFQCDRDQLANPAVCVGGGGVD